MPDSLEGYHDDPTLDLAMGNAAQVLRQVAKHPQVAAAALRLEGRRCEPRRQVTRVMIAASPRATSAITVLTDAVIDG